MSRKLIVEVVLDSAAYSRQIKQAQAKTAGFSKDLERVGRGTTVASLGFRGLGRSVAFASGWFIGGAGLGAAVKASFDEMANAQKVSAQTAAVLKSTGGAAGVTAQQVDDLAGSLMNLSGVDDEAIHSAENLLLTFTNIKREAFEPATEAALDMSVALQEDLQTAALQVGKALQDPVKGITALRRAGVSFTAGQQRLIASLVASGQHLEAQKIILQELTREFGGSAEAAGQTLPGQLDILKQSVLNLGGAIAEKLNPPLTDATKKLNKFLEDSKQPGSQANQTKAGLQVVAHWAGVVAENFRIAGLSIGNYLRVEEKLLQQLGRFGPTTPQPGAGAVDKLLGGLRGTKASGKVDLRTAGGIAVPDDASAKDINRLFGISTEQVQARNRWFDQMIARAQMRASLLPTLTAQIAALRKVQALLKQRFAVTNDITRQQNLEDEILQNAASISALITQRTAETQAAAEERKQKALEAAQAARDEALAWADFAVERAGVTKTLRDDLKANQARLELLQKQAGVGKKTAEQARAIWEQQQEITRIRKEMARDQSGGTLFRPVNANAFIQSLGLGLSPDQVRRLRAGIVQFGPGGTLPGQHTGAFALAGGVQINGGVHLHGVQNTKQMEEELAKRAKARPHTRRGAR